MNVNKEADAAFMAELRTEDPARYARLMKNMRHAVHKQELAIEGSRAQTVQQKQWDKMAARRAKATGELPVGWRWCAYEPCKAPFRPARADSMTCSRRCRYRLTQTDSTRRMDTGDESPVTLGT